jgi:hypothetical protein
LVWESLLDGVGGVLGADMMVAELSGSRVKKFFFVDSSPFSERIFFCRI